MMRTKLAYATLATATTLAGCATATPVAPAPAAREAAAAAPIIETVDAPDLTNTKGKQGVPMYTVQYTTAGNKVKATWKAPVKAPAKAPVKATSTMPSPAPSWGPSPTPSSACGDSVDVETTMAVPALPAIIAPTTGPLGANSGGGTVPGGTQPFGLPPGVSSVTISLHAHQTVAYTNFGGAPYQGTSQGGSLPMSTYGQIPYAPNPGNDLPGIPGVAGTPLSGLAGVNATGDLTIRDDVGDTLHGRVTTIMANPDGGAANGRNMVATVAGFLDNGNQFVVTVQDTDTTNGINAGPFAFHGALVSFSGSILVGATPAMGMTAMNVPYIFTSYIPFGNGHVEVELGKLCTSLNFLYGGYTHP